MSIGWRVGVGVAVLVGEGLGMAEAVALGVREGEGVGDGVAGSRDRTIPSGIEVASLGLRCAHAPENDTNIRKNNR